MLSRVPVFTALGLLLAAHEAGAQEREATIRLALDPELVARGCPSAEAIAPAVEAHLGRPLGTGVEPTDLVLDAIGDSSEGVSATLTLRWADGEALGTRRIETDDRTCQTLAEGLPLVIAMMADLHREEATLRLLERGNDGPLEEEPVVIEAVEREPVEEAPLAPVERVIALSQWIGTALDLGTFPELTIRPDAQLRLHIGDLASVALTAGLIIPQTHRSAPQEGVELWGATGGIAGCIGGAFGSVRLDGCGELEAGWVRSTGLGFAMPQRAEAFHLAAVLGPRLTFRAGPFGVSVDLGASVPVVGQRFTFLVGAVERELFASAPVTFRAALRIGLYTGAVGTRGSP